MSKRSEEAACEYAGLQNPPTDDSGVLTATDYYTFLDGYEQAEKDVWDRIEKYLSNRNPTDYATVGWILKNIEEYKKKIMEEEKC